MKTGIVFGGYCPLHRGHLDVVMRAKKECDKVTMIVCGYDGEPRGEEIGCDLAEREGIIKEFFSDDEQIQVTSINDTTLGIDESMSIENWKTWTTEAERLAGTEDVIYYVAEPEYLRSLTTLEKKVVLLGRDLLISGTEIRKHPIKNWDYITEPFREILGKKILITGTASEGKTTLCKDISKYFGIPWIPEYGRASMERTGKKDDELTGKDFQEFLDKQFLTVPVGEKLWISDTDNLVTLMYARAYYRRPEMAMTVEDYKNLKIGPLPQWDKIFLIPPHSENFVDDGTRYMAQSGMDERIRNYEVLKHLMNRYGYKYEELRGDYLENFLAVKEYIQGL